MAQNKRSGEETVGENQRSGEEMNQNERTGEEIADNQRSGEKTVGGNQSSGEKSEGGNQSSGDKTEGENQSSRGDDNDEENGENQSSRDSDGGDEENGENQSSLDGDGGDDDDEENGENQSSRDGDAGGDDEENGENQSIRDDDDVDDDDDQSSSSSDDDDDEWVGGKRCEISNLAHPHYLSRQDGYNTNQKCCSCGEFNQPGVSSRRKRYHHYCTICQVELHRNCRLFPSKIIHSYHLQHPLTFTFLNHKTGMIADTKYSEYHDPTSIVLHKTTETLSESSLIFDKCTWCSNDLGRWFYRCLICNFSLDIHCFKLDPPPTIQNPKSHHHSLSLFPQPPSFPCHACGLIDAREPSYACYQCNYVVHKSCVDLPRVIKITRHPHRLSLTPYLPTKRATCRVCYQNVDIKYGHYSCNHGDCSYVAHSRCATHKGVWDGKDLEWAHEESDEAKDIVAPYKKVGGGLIEHFSHPHHFLKLEKYDGSRDRGKRCHACMQFILSSPDDFYNCIECEYFIHEVVEN